VPSAIFDPLLHTTVSAVLVTIYGTIISIKLNKIAGRHRQVLAKLTADIVHFGPHLLGTSKLNYESSADRSGKLTSPSVPLGTLGVVAAFDASRVGHDDIAGTGGQEMIRSLERTFSEAGGRVILYNIRRKDGLFDTVATAVDSLVQQRVDALVLIGIIHAPTAVNQKTPDWQSMSIPTVHICGEGDFQAPVHVYYDNREAGEQAANHLLSVGCRSIVFLAPFTMPWLDHRIQGARLAIEEAGLPAECLRVHPSNHPLTPFSEEAGVEFDAAIREAFEQSLLTDGVIAANDGVAHRIIHHAAQWGKRIGTDFALIGFDDIHASSFAGLTSLRPPFDELGREAAGLVIRMLGGEPIRLQVCLPCYLTVRSSTRGFRPERLGATG
jgi:DNA-binding LacI/PurR family transcriptional regulator